MEALTARIDSFNKSKRVKKYPKKATSTSVSVKWPHPPSFKANAYTLAEAGFYFAPSWGDRDSVACFICGKELGEWDSDDDPFEIHYAKCGQTCPWAKVRCGLSDDMDKDGEFRFSDKGRVPTSKAMEQARLGTFGEWWPHDEVHGHSAQSTAMAQAGFVYTPQFTGDDTVTCLYCNLSLGGWEDGDNPIDEHRKRQAKLDKPCVFFPASTSKSKPQSRAPNQSRATSTAKPRAPSRSQSKAKVNSTAEDSTAVSEDEPPRAPSRGSSKTRASTAKPRTTSRTQSHTRMNSVLEDDAVPSEEEEHPARRRTTRAPSKARTVSTSKPRTTRVQSKPRATEDDTADEQPRPASKTRRMTTTAKPRTTSRSHSKAVVLSDDEAEEPDEESDVGSEAKPAAKPRVTSHSHSKAAVVSEIEVEDSDEEGNVAPKVKTTAKPRNTSRSHSKVTVASNMDAEGFTEEMDDLPKAKTTSKLRPVSRTGSKASMALKAKSGPSDDELAMEQSPEPELEHELEPQPEAKPKRVPVKGGINAKSSFDSRTSTAATTESRRTLSKSVTTRALAAHLPAAEPSSSLPPPSPSAREPPPSTDADEVMEILDELSDGSLPPEPKPAPAYKPEPEPEPIPLPKPVRKPQLKPKIVPKTEPESDPILAIEIEDETVKMQIDPPPDESMSRAVNGRPMQIIDLDSPEPTPYLKRHAPKPFKPTSPLKAAAFPPPPPAAPVPSSARIRAPAAVSPPPSPPPQAARQSPPTTPISQKPGKKASHPQVAAQLPAASQEDKAKAQSQSQVQPQAQPQHQSRTSQPRQSQPKPQPQPLQNGLPAVPDELPTPNRQTNGAIVLTPEEREMTVEQWIRHEIELSYDRLLADGREQIRLFQQKAAETRRRIEAL